MPTDKNNSTKLDIFTYTNHRDFLRDHFAESKRQNKNFSFRYFAREAGFLSGSTPKMIIDGTRQFTLDSVRKFAKGLKLGKREAAYFEALIDFDQAHTAEAKSAAIHKVKLLRPKYKTALLDTQRKEYLSNPDFVVLREMVQLTDFKENADWIGQHLTPKMSVDEVKQAFLLLKQLKLITRDKKNRLTPSEPVVSTAIEVTDMDVFSYHLALLKQASEALINVPANYRHNAALTLPVPLRKMEEIKKKIVNFQQSLIEFVDDGKNDFDEVYHMCIALFPATNVKGRSL